MTPMFADLLHGSDASDDTSGLSVHPFPPSSVEPAFSSPTSTAIGCSDASDVADQPDRYRTGVTW